VFRLQVSRMRAAQAIGGSARASKKSRMVTER
jgi:hypothetical protein